MVDSFVRHLKQYFTRTSMCWCFHGLSAVSIPQLSMLDSYFVDYDFSPVGINSNILCEFEAIQPVVISQPAPLVVESHDVVAKVFECFLNVHRRGSAKLVIQANQMLAAGAGRISSFGLEHGPNLLLNHIQQKCMDNVMHLFEVLAS